MLSDQRYVLYVHDSILKQLIKECLSLQGVPQSKIAVLLLSQEEQQKNMNPRRVQAEEQTSYVFGDN